MDVKKNIDNFYIAKLLLNNNNILYFNGRSEAGPRALGNRSLLSNPCSEHTKNIVNSLKKREWFRPLACTILEEHFEHWFITNGQKSSFFMTEIFFAQHLKKQIIPSVIHVDGSCRVQTINKNQNPNYYDLILIFYQLSGVPLLLNTSFNNAGEPIVETPDDALQSFFTSDFNFLYFADVQYLIIK